LKLFFAILCKVETPLQKRENCEKNHIVKTHEVFTVQNALLKHVASCTEGITARLESMRMQSHWLPVWAQLSPQDWCKEFKQAKAWLASSLHDLKDNTIGLSAQSVKRIQHCFTLGQLRAQVRLLPNTLL